MIVGGRAEAGGESESELGRLERGEALLERRPRRVPDPGVVVALVNSDRLLCKGGGLVDGRRHGAGGRVGLLAGMDRPRLEVHGRDRSYRRTVSRPQVPAQAVECTIEAGVVEGC